MLYFKTEETDIKVICFALTRTRLAQSILSQQDESQRLRKRLSLPSLDFGVSWFTFLKRIWQSINCNIYLYADKDNLTTIRNSKFSDKTEQYIELLKPGKLGKN